jgi:hypothetical protein
LAHVLGRIGDALVAVDATALLALEGELSGALAALCATKIGDRAAARAAAKQGLAALQRCQRLGASLPGVSRALRQAEPTHRRLRPCRQFHRADRPRLLRAPIVINPRLMIGFQVMPHDCLYTIRHPLSI